MNKLNNVIFLLIDSVYSECLGKRKTEISSTPFIDSLSGNAVYAPNIYSYGPYTDAASKALYCGNRTLDDYGYFFGLGSSEYSHFRLFHENGYETFGLYYPYYLLDSKVERYIDHSLYTTGFKYISVWGGKFDHYAQLKNSRGLNELEYKVLAKCLDVVFDSWFLFYDNIKSQDSSDAIIREIYNASLNGTGYDGLKAEHEKYQKDPNGFIDEVLALGMEHPLAKVNEFDYGREDDASFVRDVYNKYPEFFSKLSRKNLKCNIFNNPISIKKSFNCIFNWLKTRDKSELRYFGNYGMLILHNRLMIERSQKPKWQDLASLNKQIEVLVDAIDNRPVGETKPFYASLHALEPHHNISFFSFDAFDFDKVAEELDYISPLIDGCGKKFSGNLLYQMSLMYVDFCVKKLFEELEKRGLLDNTNIVLVSDHGTSYSFDPVRTRVVNTFHKENYNIPLFVWGKNISREEAGTYEGVYCSDDVLPTLCDVLGIEKPAAFTGKSILKPDSEREYVITEYMGPGVPDMLSREAWLSCRTKNYVIAYKHKLDGEFDEKNISVMYDLTRDPKEKKSIKTLDAYIENEEIQGMISKLKDRYYEIINNRDEFVRNEVLHNNKQD